MRLVAGEIGLAAGRVSAEIMERSEKHRTDRTAERSSSSKQLRTQNSELRTQKDAAPLHPNLRHPGPRGIIKR